MAIGPVSYRYLFSVDNNAKETTDTLKILGVTLNCKLNFVAHVSEQVKKKCAKASALRRIRWFIPLDVMCGPYKAYLLHRLEYCCTLLLGVGIGQVKKLEDTNNYIVYILRSSLGYGEHTPYNHNARTKKKISDPGMVLVYKCINKEAPSKLHRRISVIITQERRGHC